MEFLTVVLFHCLTELMSNYDLRWEHAVASILTASEMNLK